MASTSIQARIDSGVWESMRRDGETNTEVLQRIAAHYQATSADELQQIAPTPDAAIAVLLQSHKMLTQLMGNAAIALPDTAPTPAPPPTEPSNALASADDW